MLTASSSMLGLRAASTATRFPASMPILATGSSISRRTVDFAPSCPLTRRLRTIVASAAASAPHKTPSVKIDNIHDAFATLVTVDMGITGEMLETVGSFKRGIFGPPPILSIAIARAQITALKNLGLNIKRAKLSTSGETTFLITEAQTSEKIVKSARLEEIRMTGRHQAIGQKRDYVLAPAWADHLPLASLQCSRQSVRSSR